MQALLLSRYRHLEIIDAPPPTPGPAEVLVRVAACGICGSDVHGYEGSSGRRIPPIIMGHEAAGIVTAAGQDVKNVSPGDRVTFDSTIFCGVCSFCQCGEINLCDHRQVLGVSCSDYRRAGAFAEYVVVPSRIVYRVPDELRFEEAAMLEAVAVALHAVSLAKIPPDGTALVVGAGMIGLLLAQALRVARCGRVIVADLDGSRLELAKEVGATDVLRADGVNIIGELRALSNGGVDLAVEAVGKNQSVRLAIESVRKAGIVVLVGNISPEVTLPLQNVVTRQIRMQGSCASAGEYPQAIELVASKKIDVRSLITAVAPLHEGPQWFERLSACEPNLMKIVLTPGAPQ